MANTKNDSFISFELIDVDEQMKFTVSYSDAIKENGEYNLLNSVLEEYGVAIVTYVLDKNERADLESDFVADLRNTVEYEQDSTSRCQREFLNEYFDGKDDDVKAKRQNFIIDDICQNGLMATRGLPHGKFAWKCRLNEKIKKLFGIIFHEDNSDALATGLDCPFFSPLDAEVQSANYEWLHVDQNDNNGITHKLYQGVLYVWGSENKDASTTVVWPKSHKHIYDQMMSDSAAIQSQHTINVNGLRDMKNMDIYPKAVEGSKRLSVPPGSLLLWNSRLIHQGWKSGPRLAMPLCWEPRFRADKEALARKLWMCATALPSTHSAVEGRVHCVVSTRISPKPYCSDGMEQFPFSLLPVSTPWCIKPEAFDGWLQLQPHLWKTAKSDGKNEDSLSQEEMKMIKNMLRDDAWKAL